MVNKNVNPHKASPEFIGAPRSYVPMALLSYWQKSAGAGSVVLKEVSIITCATFSGVTMD